jgi:hypothetical protein
LAHATLRLPVALEGPAWGVVLATWGLGPKPRKQWGKRADFGGKERKLQKLMGRKDELWHILRNFVEKLEETWELSWEHDDIFLRDSLEETWEIDLKNWNFGVLPF